MAVHRGSIRRQVCGGRAGLAWAAVLRQRRAVCTLARGLLVRPYDALARTFGGRFVPRALRPRVICFRAGGRDELRLIWRGRVVGWIDPGRGRWVIPAPFRLLVDQAALPHRTP
jgi:hypothetical protein